MPDLLRIGSEFDVGPIVAGAQQAVGAFDRLAAATLENTKAHAAVTEAINLAKNSEDGEGVALTVLAEAQQRAALAGAELAAAQRAVSAEMGTTRGNIHMARLEVEALRGASGGLETGLARVAARSAMLGPIMSKAFPTFIAVAFVEVLVHTIEKVHELYENVILLKGAIESWGKLEEEIALKTQSLNYQYEEGLARRLEKQNKLAEAAEMFRKAESDKPLEIPKLKDPNVIKGLSADFVAFMALAHTSADAPTIISRIQAEVAATQSQLEKENAVLKEMQSYANVNIPDEAGIAISGPSPDQQARVDNLTKKLDALRGMLKELKMEGDVSGQHLQDQLDGVAKKTEQVGTESKKTESAIAKLIEQLTIEAEHIGATNFQIQEYKLLVEGASVADINHASALHTKIAIYQELEKEQAKHIELTKEEESQARLAAAAKGSQEAQAEIEAGIPNLPGEMPRIPGKLDIPPLPPPPDLSNWKKAEQQIDKTLDTMTKGVLMGTQTMSQAFARLGVNMVISVVEAFEKMIIHAALSEMKMLVTHIAANEAKVTSDAAAAEQTKAISATSSLKEVTHAAAAAAAKAYEAMSGIPVVGPVLGAAAAVATFTGVMAFEAMASAEQGAYVPRDMAIFAHGGEMVLPKEISDGMRAMIAQPGGGGGSSNVNVHFNTFDSKGLSDFLHQPGNRAAFTKAVRTAARNGMRFR